jgi:hypothetical protein
MLMSNVLERAALLVIQTPSVVPDFQRGVQIIAWFPGSKTTLIQMNNTGQLKFV